MLRLIEPSELVLAGVVLLVMTLTNPLAPMKSSCAAQPARDASASAPEASSKNERAPNAIQESTFPEDLTSAQADPRASGNGVSPSPLDAPRCPFGQLKGVLQHTGEQKASAAFIAASPGGSARARQFGARIGDYRVVYVGDHPKSHVPSTWLAAPDGSLCRLELGAAAATPDPGRNLPPKATDSPNPALNTRLPPRITAISESEFQVERSLLLELLGNPARLIAGSAIIPTPGQGLVVRHLRTSNLLFRLGLRPGDVITNINGFELSDLSQAMNAVARLQYSERLTIQVSAAGKTRTVSIDLT